MFFHGSTGRPLTPQEVAAIHAIIEKYLRDMEGVLEPAAVVSAMAEERLRVMEKTGVPLEKFLATEVPRSLQVAIAKFGIPPAVARAIQYGHANTGVYLQGFGQQLQADVVRTINNAMRTGTDPLTTARQLWKTFGDFNRDWRQIAVTEAAMNSQHGFLLGRPAGSYVVGLSRRDACAWCARWIHGKVFKVVEPPKEGEDRDWDKEVWVGKSNYGRYQHHREKATGRLREDYELWKPCCPAHPNCRCRWQPFDPRYMEVVNGSIRVKGGK
jgi:hypothetical protein